MTGVDGDGFRTDPNGDRFELIITTAAIQPDFIPLGELLKTYFEAVGIRTTLDVIENDLFNRAHECQRVDGNHPLERRSHLGIGHLPGLHAAEQGSLGTHVLPVLGLERAKRSSTAGLHSGILRPARRPQSSSARNRRKVRQPGQRSKPGSPATTPPSGPRVSSPSRSFTTATCGNVPKEGYTEDRALDYGMEQLFYVNPESH